MIYPGNTILQFEDCGATVGYTDDYLYVQAFDDYGFQHELSVKKNEDSWIYHIYWHPGVRRIEKVPERAAKKFINRFVETCKQYPSSLFNERTTRNARNHGFYKLAWRLHFQVNAGKELYRLVI